MATIQNGSTTVNWHKIILNYNQPSMSKSLWQLGNSVLPYLMLWVAMVFTLKVSFWLTIPLIILAAGFLIRIFIIFHDCGHGSFFKSRKLNFYVGSVCGLMAFTPYHKWTDSHREHHQTVGNLDKRGKGDVWTLTVKEYLAMKPFKRFSYRFFRHPLVLLGIGGVATFIVGNRFSNRSMNKKQRLNVYFSNVILLAVAIIVSYFIGWQVYLLLQLSIMFLAAMGGIYLFYLQHQYEDVIWCREEEWDYKKMALEGSSFFKLPAILRWFTGNIGYHHIHHLGPSIPNYHLRKCYRENEIFRDVQPITLFQSFKALSIRFWDEENQKAVRLRDLKRPASL